MNAGQPTNGLILAVTQWAAANIPVRAVLLTSTRAIPQAHIDALSDSSSYPSLQIRSSIVRSRDGSRRRLRSGLRMPNFTAAELASIKAPTLVLDGEAEEDIRTDHTKRDSTGNSSTSTPGTWRTRNPRTRPSCMTALATPSARMRSSGF